MRPHRIPTATSPRPPAPMRWANVTDPLTCTRCGVTWMAGDPAITLPCRGCDAEPGQPCRRWAGGNENVCAQRDHDARQAGLLKECEALTWDGRHSKPLRLWASSVGGTVPDAIRTGTPVARFAA